MKTSDEDPFDKKLTAIPIKVRRAMMIRAENAGNKECQHIKCGQQHEDRFGLVIAEVGDISVSSMIMIYNTDVYQIGKANCAAKYHCQRSRLISFLSFFLFLG